MTLELKWLEEIAAVVQHSHFAQGTEPQDSTLANTNLTLGGAIRHRDKWHLSSACLTDFKTEIVACSGHEIGPLYGSRKPFANPSSPSFRAT